MDMNWLESLLYGLVSGFAEFLPISSAAHQALMKQLFGVEENIAVHNLLVHIALLAVLIYSCRAFFTDMNGQGLLRTRGRKSARPQRSADMRLVRTAAVPFLLSFLLYRTANAVGDNRVFLVLLFFLNGIILYVPSRMLSGNKDARAMSGWDGVLIGLSGALSMLPGISRVGVMTSTALARGADRQNALNWALLLSIPALIVLIVVDLLSGITGGFEITSVSGVLLSVLSMIGAGCGGYFGIMLMRFLAVKAGFTGFAYYSWGAALFSFVMYLTVV